MIVSLRFVAVNWQTPSVSWKIARTLKDNAKLTQILLCEMQRTQTVDMIQEKN